MSLMVKPVGEPDAGNPHVRFDERGRETGPRCAPVPAPFLDSTEHRIGSVRIPEGDTENSRGQVPARRDVAPGYCLLPFQGRCSNTLVRRTLDVHE